MKQIGSVITGSGMAKRWSTGGQPGATGSGGLQLSNVSDQATTLPAELRTIELDSLRPWMEMPASTLSWEILHYGTKRLETAANALALACSQVEQALPPVSREEIVDVLGSIAEMLQVSVPSTLGIKLYFGALKDMPSYKFKAAALKLIKTHKWPKLPLPADFIEAAKEERKDLDQFVTQLNRADQRVKLALQKLHSRS